MQITKEWLDSIQDEQGLTRGQVTLINLWAKRQAYVGYGYLPNQVANFLAGCRGYRGMDNGLQDMLDARARFRPAWVERNVPSEQINARYA